MKKIDRKVVPAVRTQKRAKESIIANCQLVSSTTLRIRSALENFKAPISERGDYAALKVIQELDCLAEFACTNVAHRLVRLTGPRRVGVFVESPLQLKDGTDSAWAPTTWTDIHAELLTCFVQSVEICRRALNSIEPNFDRKTSYMLREVLMTLEEMVWVVEMNPPKTSAELCRLGRGNISEVQEMGDIERTSCALMTCNPPSTLEVVSGILELSDKIEDAAWFVPQADSNGYHVRLDKRVVERMVDVHPEPQPLFQGCTHVIELSAGELRNLDPRLQEFIVRPLLEAEDEASCSANESAA